MKKIFFFVLLTHIVCYSQNSINRQSFSVFSAGLFGGFSTTDFVKMEGTGLIELETNLSQNVFVNFSGGYYLIKQTEKSDLINYKITPVFIGLKYFLMHGHTSPFLTIETGYNFYRKTVNSRKGENKNNFYTGIGLGLYYNYSKNIKMEIKYLYKFNNTIINVSNLMIGIIYSL